MMKSFVFIFIFLCFSSAFAERTKTAVSCKPPIEFFKPASPHDVLNVDIMMDYAKLIESFRDEEIKAVLSVKTSAGFDILPAIIVQRGGVRRTMCTDLPYRIIFLKTEISRSIEQQMARENLQLGSKPYLQRYYQIFSGLTVTAVTDSANQVSTVFADLGTDIKVVTHCGITKNPDPMYKNKSWLDANQRLLSEYYLYRVMGLFNIPAESARLVNIHIMNQEGWNVQSGMNEKNEIVHSNFAFIREPKKLIAARCGLSTAKPKQLVLTKTEALVDSWGEYQARFANAVVGNIDYDINTERDGHNMDTFYTADGFVFAGPYDFDMAPLVKFLGSDVTYENSFGMPVPFEEVEGRNYERTMAIRALKEERHLFEMVRTSHLTEDTKSKFEAWFTNAFKVIRESATLTTGYHRGPR